MERSRTRQLRSRPLRKWRNNIDELSEKTGVSLEEVCRYAGFVYNGKETAIYKKLPRKRSAFIGVGMAFGMLIVGCIMTSPLADSIVKWKNDRLREKEGK